MITEIYTSCAFIEKSITDPLLIKLYKSRSFISSSPFVFHLSSSSSSFFLPLIFPLLHLIYTLHSLCRASFLFRWPAERVIYCQQKRPQNLKPVRVYTFCVRLFIPCITMRAHASIILSAWFITSRSSGPLRKYGNYNCDDAHGARYASPFHE